METLNKRKRITRKYALAFTNKVPNSNIQEYNGKKYLLFDDVLKFAQLITV